MDGYDRGGHSKYSLKVHLIFVTKYRKKIFQASAIAADVKVFLNSAAKKCGCHIVRMETDKDHVHILLSYDPTNSVSEIVKRLKQYSTYHIWQEHGRCMVKTYWKRKVLWSDGYFACSVGQVSQKTIERYIQNQG